MNIWLVFSAIPGIALILAGVRWFWDRRTLPSRWLHKRRQDRELHLRIDKAVRDMYRRAQEQGDPDALARARETAERVGLDLDD